MVVGVFMGSRPNAGFSTTIIGATAGNGALIVRYAEKLPAPGSISAQVLTFPYPPGGDSQGRRQGREVRRKRRPDNPIRTHHRRNELLDRPHRRASPGLRLRYTIAASMRIGIDLGGTKIEGIAIAGDGHERLRRRIASPRGDYAHTLRAVAGLVREIEQEFGEAGFVGVGIPGTISPATGLVKNANSTWLNGRALAEDLSRLLDRPIRFANDANCFALSEATDGAAAGLGSCSA